MKNETQDLYEKIAKDIKQGKIGIPFTLKIPFLALNALSERKQLVLINKLGKQANLPKKIRDLVEIIQFKQAPFVEEVPDDIHKKILGYCDKSSRKTLVTASKTMHSLFQPDRLFPQFLQQAVYGRWDKIETLCLLWKEDKKLQYFLCKEGIVTDYSGRTFCCTVYEYAYWARDTRLCRVLECYMDETTKAKILKCCEAIEKKGLSYTQRETLKKSKHFDLTPLKNALQYFANGFKHWYESDNWDEMQGAWMKVGLEQRDVPAYVIYEYCKHESSFISVPNCNKELIRCGLTFRNCHTDSDESVFPLMITEFSGLGVDFALSREAESWRASSPNLLGISRELAFLLRDTEHELSAISSLDELKTKETKQSLENLKPTELKQESVCVIS